MAMHDRIDSYTLLAPIAPGVQVLAAKQCGSYKTVKSRFRPWL